MKKILIGLIVLIFVCSTISGIVGQAENTIVFKERKQFKEDRTVIPIYTEHGLERASGSKGKPTKTYVTITYPANGATVSGTVDITVEFNTDADPIIAIDGADVGSGSSYSWDTTICADGSHTIKAYAGRVKDTATVTVSNGGGGDGGDGTVNKYALVIGISDYEGTQNDLDYCDDDAEDWKAFLQGEGYSVTILKDTQATAANIQSELIDLLDDEDADDYVVFCYSGHGYNYPGHGSSIVTTDLYYMTHGYFEAYFDTAESQHIYFAFDACQIGGFQGLIEAGRVGAFASNARSSSDGDESMENGVFTYYQMEGWGIYNTFEEDAAYAVQEFKAWAPRYIKVDPFYVDQFSGSMLP
jgi:hypothetical protein